MDSVVKVRFFRPSVLCRKQAKHNIGVNLLQFRLVYGGIVPIRRASAGAALYRRATVGLVFSLTTHSLVAQEMMASGLPVVELAGENVSSALGESGELVVQAERNPVSVAAAIEGLLDDPEGRATMARRARSFVEERTWERSGDQLEQALRAFLAAPRTPVTAEASGQNGRGGALGKPPADHLVTGSARAES